MFDDVCEFATLIVCLDRAPQGTPIEMRRILLVFDPEHAKPILKLPGGEPNGNDTPDETARRELLEETGIEPDVLTRKGAIERLGRHGRNDHLQYVYVAVADLDTAKKIGDENGKSLFVVTSHTVGQIVRREVKFLHPHREALEIACKL